MRRRWWAVWTTMAVLTGWNLAIAHDIWITGQPGLYLSQPDTVTVIATVGSYFPKIEIAIGRDRIGETYWLDPLGNRWPIQWKVERDRTVARIEMTAGGHHVVILTQKPRWIEIPARDFKTYLDHEGLERAIAIWRQSGNVRAPAREVYTRYIKALFHVAGKQEDTGYTQSLGLRAEIVPLDHPCAGGRVRVRVLFAGRAAVDQTVLYGTDGRRMRRVKTDDRGVATLQIDRAGVWFVKTIDMHHHDPPMSFGNRGAEWESHWAILTFEVVKRQDRQ